MVVHLRKPKILFYFVFFLIRYNICCATYTNDLFIITFLYISYTFIKRKFKNKNSYKKLCTFIKQIYNRALENKNDAIEF